MELEGTRTEQNLKKALAGEAVARTKYLAFAEKARAEGHEDIAHLFQSLSVNEDAHCQLLCRYLFETKSTNHNLQTAAAGERDEWGSMYPSFADIAESEGFDNIAKLFRCIAKVERDHDFRFKAAVDDLKQKRTEEEPSVQDIVGFRCVRCGTVYVTKPHECELCHGHGPFIPDHYFNT